MVAQYEPFFSATTAYEPNALSGMATLAYFQSSDPLLGSGYELQAIAAAVGGAGFAAAAIDVANAMVSAASGIASKRLGAMVIGGAPW